MSRDCPHCAPDDITPAEVAPPEEARRAALPPAARRALEEADARRRAAAPAAPAPPERGGPKGDEPTRYGDWERNGRAIDF